VKFLQNVLRAKPLDLISNYFWEMTFNFVSCRIGRGIWRRGAETPVAVKWEDRSIEVREGSWSYIASTSSVGYAPGNFSMHHSSFSATHHNN
jgi:hypothetical protein